MDSTPESKKKPLQGGGDKNPNLFKSGKDWTGNRNGRAKHELVDVKSGTIVPKTQYALRWTRSITKRYQKAARKGLTALLDIAQHSKNDAARVSAIREINLRALGTGEQAIRLEGMIQHEHGPSGSYLTLLEEMNRRLQEKQQLIAEQSLIESKTSDAEFEVITEKEKKDE